MQSAKFTLICEQSLANTLGTKGSSSCNRGVGGALPLTLRRALLFLKEPSVVTQGAVIKLIYNLISGSSLTFYRVIKSHRESSTVFLGPSIP